MLITSGEWTGGKAALATDWQRRPRPAGITSYTVLTDADGDVVRDYAQWTTPRAADWEIPGVTRRDHAAYELYRGTPDLGRTPGAIVVVRVDTDGPDLSRTWVDAVFEALAGDTALPAGGLGAHFFISTDGTRVLNYAAWESADAHRRAMAANGGGVGRGPLWDRVRTMPGVRPQSVTRFHVHTTLTA